MGLNKITGILPHENTCADLVPMSYFYDVLKNIQKVEEDIINMTYEDGRQPLLVHLDMLLSIARKYPNTAAMCIYKLKRKHLKDTFEAWWERNQKKIPKKYRTGIRQNADELFDELFAIKSWAKSE